MVELYASDNNLIATEAELSELFDRDTAPLVIQKYGENDAPAMREAFNDWTDSLCKDQEIHPEQYNCYCYVGKYSGE
jgi:glycosidase